MAEHFYISDKIEILRGKFAENQQRKNDVFTKELMITQTKGMNMWISKELAVTQGVFANFIFETPHNFVTELYRLCQIELVYTFNAHNLSWEIYRLLADESFKETFPFVADYYSGDEIKRMQLAVKTADLFDQYLIYRTDYIDAWNNDQKIDDNSGDNADDFRKHEKWQKWLWNRLITQYPSIKVDQRQELLSKLKDLEVQQRIQDKYPVISLFCISVLTDFHTEIYKALSRFTDVSYYLISPSKDKWWENSDATDGNDLLSNCKATAQYTFSILLENVVPESIHYLYNRSEAHNLLCCLQNDLLLNTTDGIKAFSFDENNDFSLEISSSYSEVREVEALYNYILHVLELNPDINISDICVQVSNVSQYAPLIKAVFDNGPEPIPYTIADVGYTDGDTLVNALSAFFNLSFENYSSEAILNLLESKYVRNRFDIADCQTIRNIISHANICMGVEGNKNDDTYLLSWKHGLNKLILGYAIKGGGIYAYENDHYCLTDSFEGADAHDIFRLNAFIETIVKLSNKIKSDKSLQGWQQFLLKDLLPGLFEINRDAEEEFAYIQKQLLNLQFLMPESDELIPFSVIKQSVIHSLSNETRNSNYISGKLTVCSMLPVRSIPYKLVAVLGLNSDSFPRNVQMSAFDLMSLEPRKGDRNMRNNDKYLFLEILMASRKCLYLSYIGQSCKDNSELPPSILVEELIEYLSNNKNIPERIITKHPLHGFSRKYFDSNPRLFTYLSAQAQEEKTESLGQASFHQLKEEKVITLNNLVRFFKNPIQHYYNNVLGIYYGVDEESLPENEVFNLDSLGEWQLKHDLVYLDDEKEADYLFEQKSKGLLPLANMAKIYMNHQKEAIQDLKERMEEIINKSSNKPLAFELPVGDYMLTGNIATLFPPYHVYVNVSHLGSQPKYIQEAHLQHIVLCALGEMQSSHFISTEYNYQLPKAQFTKEQALKILEELIKWYIKGHENLLIYSPEAGSQLAKGDVDDALSSIIDNKYCPYIAKEHEKGCFASPELLDTSALQELSILLFKDFSPIF